MSLCENCLSYSRFLSAKVFVGEEVSEGVNKFSLNQPYTLLRWCRPAPPIPPEIQSALRETDFIGYAPNVPGRRGNLVSGLRVRVSV